MNEPLVELVTDQDGARHRRLVAVDPDWSHTAADLYAGPRRPPIRRTLLAGIARWLGLGPSKPAPGAP